LAPPGIHFEQQETKGTKMKNKEKPWLDPRHAGQRHPAFGRADRGDADLFAARTPVAGAAAPGLVFSLPRSVVETAFVILCYPLMLRGAVGPGRFSIFDSRFSIGELPLPPANRRGGAQSKIENPKSKIP
jgi:hypothetical protein